MSTSHTLSHDAIGELYLGHHGYLLNWLRHKLGCRQQAADLAQDTFIKLLNHRQRHNQPLDIREPRAYLTTVAGRLVKDHYRRQSLETAYQEALAALPEQHYPSAETQHLIREALYELDTILDRLKPKVCQAFLLSQLDGLTYAAIAEQLDVNLRTVKRYMATAFEECIMVMA